MTAAVFAASLLFFRWNINRQGNPSGCSSHGIMIPVSCCPQKATRILLFCLSRFHFGCPKKSVLVVPNCS